MNFFPSSFWKKRSNKRSNKASWTFLQNVNQLDLGNDWRPRNFWKKNIWIFFIFFFWLFFEFSSDFFWWGDFFWDFFFEFFSEVIFFNYFLFTSFFSKLLTWYKNLHLQGKCDKQTNRQTYRQTDTSKLLFATKNRGSGQIIPFSNHCHFCPFTQYHTVPFSSGRTHPFFLQYALHVQHTK